MNKLTPHGGGPKDSKPLNSLEVGIIALAGMIYLIIEYWWILIIGLAISAILIGLIRNN